MKSGKPIDVTFDGLIKNPRFYLIQFCQVEVQHDLQAPNLVNFALNNLQFHVYKNFNTEGSPAYGKQSNKKVIEYHAHCLIFKDIYNNPEVQIPNERLATNELVMLHLTKRNASLFNSLYPGKKCGFSLVKVQDLATRSAVSFYREFGISLDMNKIRYFQT